MGHLQARRDALEEAGHDHRADPSRSHSSSRSRRSSCESVENATTAHSTLCAATARARFPLLPSTGSDSGRPLISIGSASRKPIG